MPAFLVTGGAGFVGTHLVVALQQAGHRVVVLDNFSNAEPDALDRVAAITGEPVTCRTGDVRDEAALRRVFEEDFAEIPCSAVFHLAGLKSVAESLLQPDRYHVHNLGASETLIRVMAEFGIHQLVFSSTATVYGPTPVSPIPEDAPADEPAHPYAASKRAVERHLFALGAPWRVAILRYFNPVGAHPSGVIGESPRGKPQNLMPCIARVAAGHEPHLVIHGCDYPTPDGTAMRDYLHVMDLVDGHLAALARLGDADGVQVWNLGRGEAISVRTMVSAFERVTGRPIRCRYGPRRPGDLPAYHADTAKARLDLSWEPRRDLETMVRDTWCWVQGSSG